MIPLRGNDQSEGDRLYFFTSLWLILLWCETWNMKMLITGVRRRSFPLKKWGKEICKNSQPRRNFLAQSHLKFSFSQFTALAEGSMSQLNNGNDTVTNYLESCSNILYGSFAFLPSVLITLCEWLSGLKISQNILFICVSYELNDISLSLSFKVSYWNVRPVFVSNSSYHLGLFSFQTVNILVLD